ncbi:hypothetical protein B0J11DRAFT_611861 [Dendryphion nanum]|uniref:Uncharacterized protein n=1 Tax=Dendryphion nanum TaxID=256645 RepID=A0A9P9IXN3_9PLEO|nr:hypothetical protein B0J11DRAFT_611861 [Dendryphion nanum]
MLSSSPHRKMQHPRPKSAGITVLTPNRTRSTTSSPPKRPMSAYSTTSTIRRVNPSPESLSDAICFNFIAHSASKQFEAVAENTSPQSPFRVPNPPPQPPHKPLIHKPSIKNPNPNPNSRSSIPTHFPPQPQNPTRPRSPIRRTKATRPKVRPRSQIPRPVFTTISPNRRPETPSPMTEEERRSRYAPMNVSGRKASVRTKSDAECGPSIVAGPGPVFMTLETENENKIDGFNFVDLEYHSVLREEREHKAMQCNTSRDEDQAPVLAQAQAQAQQYNDPPVYGPRHGFAGLVDGDERLGRSSEQGKMNMELSERGEERETKVDSKTQREDMGDSERGEDRPERNRLCKKERRCCCGCVAM